MKELSIKKPASTTEAGKEFNSATLAPSISHSRYGIFKAVFLLLCYIFCSCLLQTGGEKKRSMETDKENGDRFDGQEKTESSAGTRE